MKRESSPKIAELGRDHLRVGHVALEGAHVAREAVHPGDEALRDRRVVIGEIGIVANEERNKLVFEFNQTETDYPYGKSQPLGTVSVSIGVSTFAKDIDTAESGSTVYDTLKVQVRNSSGTVLATLATYSNLNAGAGYTQSSFDLSAYKGQTIQIYFVGTEDASLKTSFVVDDFVLNVTTP